MATTTVLSTVAGDTANQATYAAAAGTPGTGKLIVVLAAVTGSTDAGDCTDNRSGTYTRIRTEHFGSGASSLYLFVRDALTSSGSSHTVTVDVTGDNGTGAVVGCWYIDGMSKVGSAAVRQTQGASNQTSGTTPTLTFASSCLTGNTLLGCLANASNPAAISAPTGWAAEDWDVGYSTPTAGSWGGHRDGGFTGTAVTIGNSASQWGAIIVELDTTSGDATFDTTVGDAPAAGGSTSFTGDGGFTSTAGDAPAAGGSSTFTGGAVFDTVVGAATAAGGVTTFDVPDATFDTTAGDAPAAGGSTTFTGGAVFDTLAGSATASGGDTSFTGDVEVVPPPIGGPEPLPIYRKIRLPNKQQQTDATFASIVGAITAAGGVSTFTGTTAEPLTVAGHNRNVLELV